LFQQWHTGIFRFQPILIKLHKSFDRKPITSSYDEPFDTGQDVHVRLILSYIWAGVDDMQSAWTIIASPTSKEVGHPAGSTKRS